MKPLAYSDYIVQDPQICGGEPVVRSILITQDLDFSDARRFVPGSHSGILLVRLKNGSPH